MAVERVMTDNGPGCRSAGLDALLEGRGIRHIYTRPFSPWQSDGAGRMNSTCIWHSKSRHFGMQDFDTSAMNMPTTAKSYSCLASVTTRKAGKAMVSMSKIYSIRQMRMDGRPIAHIVKTPEISRDAVCKYLEEEDLSPRPPIKREHGSVLGRYRPTIASWPEEDLRSWRKQRHTAKRIWQRLAEEYDATTFVRKHV